MLFDNSTKGVNFKNCVKSNSFTCSFTVPFVQQKFFEWLSCTKCSTS